MPSMPVLEGIRPRKYSLSHQGIADRRIDFVRQLPYFLIRAGNYRAATNKQVGLFRSVNHICRSGKSFIRNLFCRREGSSPALYKYIHRSPQ